MTCEYAISLLKRLDCNFQSLIAKSKLVTDDLPSKGQDLYQDCFDAVDNLITYYTQLVNCCYFSPIKNNISIFSYLNYVPNQTLHGIIRELRNTAQHFEERIQFQMRSVNPFLQLSYKNKKSSWKITFGNGGYRFNSDPKENFKTEFNENNLSFHSYRLQGNYSNPNSILIPEIIRIKDIWDHTLNLAKLVEDNIAEVMTSNNLSCTTPRDISVTIKINN